MSDSTRLSGADQLYAQAQTERIAPARDTLRRTLTDTQEAAIDLYARGFNVLPLKHHEKKPFVLKPFFTARLHHCTDACHHKGRDDISDLFRRNNIGVIVGRTSRNLLALDCDSHEAFDHAGKELTARDLPFWAIAGHSGGAYFLRIIEGEVENRPKERTGIRFCDAGVITHDTKFADLEIFGNRHLIVVPPSIHPTGILYTWVTPEPRFHLVPGASLPAVSVKALDFLAVQLATEARRTWQAPELFGLPAWGALLSFRNRQIWSTGASEGERNTAITRVAYDLAGNNIDYGEAEYAIQEMAGRCSPPLPWKEARAVLKTAYSRKREPARKSGQACVWQAAREFAKSYDWSGNFGRKDLRRKAVYLACVERARLDGREIWRATTRELAELANISREGANDALHDLETAGLIRRVNAKVRREAGLYCFVGLLKNLTVESTCSCSVRIVDIPRTQAEQDVFGKLGLRAWQAWRYLLDLPVRNAGELARALHIPRSSAYQALHRLEAPDTRLVTFNAAEGLHCGEPRTDDSLQYLALSFNNGASRSQARKEKHRLERERHVNFLARAAIQLHEHHSADKSEPGEQTLAQVISV